MDDCSLNNPVENSNTLVDLLEFMEIPYDLKTDECAKEDTLDIILKTCTVSLLDNS